MAYWAIELSEGLTAAELERATAGSGDTMEQDGSTTAMLEAAGFRVLEQRDVTAAYLDVVQNWLRAAARLERPLRAVLGDDVYDERVTVRQQGFDVTRDGLHRRMFYVTEPI